MIKHRPSSDMFYLFKTDYLTKVHYVNKTFEVIPIVFPDNITVRVFFFYNHIPCSPNSCGQLSPHQGTDFSMEKQASSFLHAAHFFPHDAKKPHDLITLRALVFLATHNQSSGLVVSHGLFSINTANCGSASG